MNKLAALLTAIALFSPAFAREPGAAVKKAETKKVHSGKPMARKAAKGKAPAANPPEASLRRMDYPWETPS